MTKKDYGPEEKTVMRLLDMYGSLYEQQIVNYISNKSEDTVKKIINKLVTQHDIYRCGVSNSELTRDPTLQGVMDTGNKKRQRAFWVLLSLISSGKVNENDHMQSTEPSQIFFYRRSDPSIYEIVSINDQEEALTSVMLKNCGKIKPEIKLVVVIDNERQAAIVNKYIENVFAFALVGVQINRNSLGETTVTPSIRVVANKKK